MSWREGWLTMEEYCEKYHERANTVLARLSSGVWERGVHVACPDGGQNYVHEERARAWRDKRKDFMPPVRTSRDKP